jgi:hypothetical protein
MTKRAPCGCTLTGNGGLSACPEHWHKMRNLSTDAYVRWAAKMRRYIEGL